MHCFVVLLVALLALQGCGQTGDLYWPEQEQVEIDDEESSQSEQLD